jgi:hypothetical protein
MTPDRPIPAFALAHSSGQQCVAHLMSSLDTVRLKASSAGGSEQLHLATFVLFASCQSAHELS